MSEISKSNMLIKRKYMEYFVPTVLTAMATNIAVIVDAVIVGNMLGSSSLAVINLLSPITQLYFSLSLLFGLAASTMIAHAKGKDGTDRKMSDGIFTATVITIIIISALLMVIQFVFVDKIAGALTWVSELDDLEGLMKDYYIPTIIGTPITLFVTSSIHIIRTDGRPKLASKIIIISNVINLMMDLVAIKIFGWGIMGASIATVTGNVVGFIIVIIHFKSKHSTLRFDFTLLKHIKLYFTYAFHLITTGISGALGTMLITVRMVFLNTIIQINGGKDAIIAFSVVSMCQVFVSAFITGGSQTMIPIVSLCLGEGDMTSVKIALKQSLKVLLISSIIIVLVVELIPGLLAALYGIKQPDTMNIAIDALRISALLFPALAVSFLGLYYYMAIGKKAIATTISVVNGIVFIVPFAIILAYIFGINGLWSSLVCAQYATVLFVLVAAFVVKLKSKGRYQNLYLLEEDKNKEKIAFSITNPNIDPVSIHEAVKGYVSEPVVYTFDAVIKKINEAKLEHKKKRNMTDVRICDVDKDLIIIKNSGADVSEETFKDLENETVHILYLKALGLNQIRITNEHRE